MLTKSELKIVEKIRTRHGAHDQTQPMNIDAFAQEDVKILLALIDKLQCDAECYERSLEDNLLLEEGWDG